MQSIGNDSAGRKIVSSRAYWAILLILTWAGLSSHSVLAQTAKTEYSSMADWNLKAENLGPRGINPYYQPLVAGHKYVMEEPNFSDEGDTGHYRKEVEVLDETEKFDIPSIGGKFECAVVEEKEFLNDMQFTRSLNWYCFDKTTSTIYTMGEVAWETKKKRGDMSDTVSESWRVGEPDDNGLIEAGLIFPGTWITGGKWIIDGAEGKAFVGGEAAESGLSMETPAGTFDNCVRTREYDILDPEDVTDKVWCYGVGLVFDTSDGKLVKTSHLKGKMPVKSPYYNYHGGPPKAMPTSTVVSSGTVISEEEAKKIALETVPGEVTDIAIEKKLGGKRYVVEVIAAADGAEVDVIIEMETGKVLGTER